LGAVGSLGNAIFFGDDASGFFAEERRIEKISDTQAAASHFIFVGRTNAAGGSANGVGATRGFGGFIEFAVIRENEMSAIRDVEAALYVDATLGEGFNFGDEGGGIDDNAGANDGVPLRAENAAGDELENETIFANDDGVTGVVAASNSNDVIEGACEIVDYFAFAFIAPLRAHHDDRFHSGILPCAEVDSGKAKDAFPTLQKIPAQKRIRTPNQNRTMGRGGTQGRGRKGKRD
jgi:hypothetical protein